MIAPAAFACPVCFGAPDDPMVKGVNKLREQVERKEKEAPAELPAPTADVQLLTEIRDLLAKRPTV